MIDPVFDKVSATAVLLEHILCYKQLGLIVPVQTVLRRDILQGGLRREGSRDIGVLRNYSPGGDIGVCRPSIDLA